MHLLSGCTVEAMGLDPDGFHDWLELESKFRKLQDIEHLAWEYMQERKANTMARTKRRPGVAFKLPTTRRKPVNNLWQYAYLITGEKKIGKTSLCIEGCEEFVIQFDKPNLAYNIREVMPSSWSEFLKILKALEKAASDEDFPYTRVVIDGVAEWYAQCQEATCKHFDVEHPQDVGYAKAWHHLRDNFTDAVNRILKLQLTAKCGVIFIAHANWQETPTSTGGTIDKLVPDLGTSCAKIINGKVDAWFSYDYSDKGRALIVQGSKYVSAGHRIDGHFLTPEGERIKEIDMGSNASEALKNFELAFNNKQIYIEIEGDEPEKATKRPAKKSAAKKTSTKKSAAKKSARKTRR